MEEQLVQKQNKKVTIFAIVLSVISIGLLVAGFLLVSSDKVVMLQSLSNLFNKFDSVLDNSSLYDKIASSNDIGIKADINLVSEQASVDANLVVNYLENKTDKKSKLDFDLTMSDQKMLGLEGALANNNIYFYVDDITPSYYHTVLEYASVISSLKGNDYDKLMTLVKESVSDNVDDNDIEKKKVEITYNGKDKKVNKLSYAVTNETLKEIITSFIDSLKKDKELLKNLSNYMGITTNEMKQMCDDLISDMKFDEVETIFYYNVYYYGFNKIIKYELADIDNKPVIEYTVGDKEILNFYGEDNKVVISIEVEKKQKQSNISGYIYNSSDDTKMPFTGTLKNDTLTLIVTKDGIDLKLAITSTEEEKDNSYIYNNKFVLSASALGQEMEMGSLDIKLEYYFGQKVDVDVTKSVDISEITETDMTIIQNNLMNHPIYQLINSLSGEMEFSL